MKILLCFFSFLVLCAATVSAQAPDAKVAPTPGVALSSFSPGEKAASIPATSSNYVLQPSDAVQITVYREPDLTTAARLSGDGSITFPLIGRVVIGGMTVQQAQDTILKRLAADYLVNPQVSIIVVEYTKQYFTVLGQVQHPGAYPLPGDGDIPLLQAIGIAGGFTRLASTGHIVVKRKDKSGQEKSFKVDAKKLANDSGKGCPIQAGDTISVPESMF